jgi:hypothetical protein
VEEWRWFIMPHRIVLMILDESNPEYMNLRIEYWWRTLLQISTTGDSINILFKELGCKIIA